jgi:tRNA G10  N-methylase Trm11
VGETVTARLFDVPAVAPHPAMFSAELVGPLARAVTGAGRLLDPFAGVGGIHRVGRLAGVPVTVGVELEPEWARAVPGTVVGSALALPFPRATFDAVCTSPTYGNRLADRDARPSVAATYAKGLGRLASPGSSCHLQWGPGYRQFHERALAEVARVLVPDGRLVVNMKNHWRARRLVDVVGWWHTAIDAAGFEVVDDIEVTTPSMRNGANGTARADTEHIIIARRTHDR